jgi:hypothetical protein
MNFQDRHPAVSIELTLENRSVDLIHENVDLALRMGRPADQNLIVRRIGFSRRILVASPDYLARRGPVRSRGDLSDHDIFVTDASLSRGGTLSLCKGDATAEIAVRPRLTTNNAQVLVDALKAGRGIGTSQVLLVTDELKRGQLIRVLPEYEVRATELFLTYPSSIPAAGRSRVRRFRHARLTAHQRDLLSQCGTIGATVTAPVQIFESEPRMQEVEAGLSDLILDELETLKPRYYPYMTYGDGFRGRQGVYLARLTPALYNALSTVAATLPQAPANVEEPTPETAIARDFVEGERQTREATFFKRNPALRREAIRQH